MEGAEIELVLPTARAVKLHFVISYSGKLWQAQKKKCQMLKLKFVETG